MNALDLIQKRLEAPKNFRVVTIYRDGATKAFEVETMGQAENYATGQRRKVGKELIDRFSAKRVMVVNVVIERI